MVEFSQEEILRYARHFSVSEIGLEGQKKIKSARILLIGCGGIGSPAALYLTAAGIGKLGLIDHDTVELSNLQRQILFRTPDIGTLKVEIAKETLHALNPSPEVVAYPYSLSPENARLIFEEYDYILDGSDNYPTRYLVNDAAQKTRKILISASVFQLEGQIACFNPYEGPCYRCLYPNAPPMELIPNCSQAGVLGITPGIVALLAVNQIFMHLLELTKPADFFGKMTEFKAKTLSLQSHSIPKNLGCEGCLSKDLPQIMPFIQPSTRECCSMKNTQRSPEISAQELSDWLNSAQDFTLIDVREPHEREQVKIEPSLAIPLGKFNSDSFLTENSKAFSNLEHKLVTYCHAGIRSAKAAKILREKGFKQVYSLQGGIESWLKRLTSKAH